METFFSTILSLRSSIEASNVGLWSWGLLTLLYTPTTTTDTIRTIRGNLRIAWKEGFASTPSYAHTYQAFCLTGRSADIPFQRSNNRTTTQKNGDDFKGWALFIGGGTHSTDGETTAGWSAVARSPDGRRYVMLGLVVTTETHLAYAGARLHTNNTTELSSFIEALSFLGPAGPVARGSQACIFFDSKTCGRHMCGNDTDTHECVPLGLTSQRLLLRAQLRLRITMQHIHSHRQYVVNECADHAGAIAWLQF